MAEKNSVTRTPAPQIIARSYGGMVGLIFDQLNRIAAGEKVDAKVMPQLCQGISTILKIENAHFKREVHMSANGSKGVIVEHEAQEPDQPAEPDKPTT